MRYNRHEPGGRCGFKYQHYASYHNIKIGYFEREIRTGLVTIKRLADPFKDIAESRKAYRELKLMRKIKHQSIIEFLDVYAPETNPDELEDVFIMTKLMMGEVDQLIRTEILNQEQISYIIYQILCGLKQIHSAGIIHGDLKPSDIGYGDLKPSDIKYDGRLGETCSRLKVRILNFGLAISIKDNLDMLPYGSPHYRSPEELLGKNYGFNVDIWRVGCIFAELLIGRNRSHEWSEIIRHLGHPLSIYAHLLPARVRETLESFSDPEWNKIDAIFEDEYCSSAFAYPTQMSQRDYQEHNMSNARDLLGKLLTKDPEKRISIDQALDHPYLKMWCQAPSWFSEWFLTAPPLPELYDDSKEIAGLEIPQLRELYFKELCNSPLFRLHSTYLPSTQRKINSKNTMLNDSNMTSETHSSSAKLLIKTLVNALNLILITHRWLLTN